LDGISRMCDLFSGSESNENTRTLSPGASPEQPRSVPGASREHPRSSRAPKQQLLVDRTSNRPGSAPDMEPAHWIQCTGSGPLNTVESIQSIGSSVFDAVYRIEPVHWGQRTVQCAGIAPMCAFERATGRAPPRTGATQGTHGPHGAQGTHEPYGTQGTHGPHGAQGSHRLHGAQGPHGPNGTQGTTMGPMGPREPMGPMGPREPMGLMGPREPMGPMGPREPMGPMGPREPSALAVRQGARIEPGPGGACTVWIMAHFEFNYGSIMAPFWLNSGYILARGRVPGGARAYRLDET